MPVKLARWYRHGRVHKIRLIVLHSTETVCEEGTAGAVATYFANLPETHKASAHVVVDDGETWRCVPDRDTAYAAPPCNDDGLHIEHCGRADWSGVEWHGHEPMLRRGAHVLAHWSFHYGVPLVALTTEQLKAGHAGVVTHREVSEAYRQSTHVDPGPAFPIADELAEARLLLAGFTHSDTVTRWDVLRSIGRPGVTRGRASLYVFAHRRRDSSGARMTEAELALLNPSLHPLALKVGDRVITY